MFESNFDLRNLNTFGIGVQAKHFARFQDEKELVELLRQNPTNLDSTLIIGGGSNLLFTKNYDGLVIANRINGLKVLEDLEAHVLLEVGGGETWHDVVMHCVNQGWGGIENLSLIPGLAGAAPMQNIGAYGVELKDVFVKLEAVHLESGETHQFSGDECEFGYRESVFKKAKRGEYCISRIVIRLNKSSQLNTSYGAIEQELEASKISSPTIKDVSEAVINIRQSKLPNPAEIGNAGSFFKNPVVAADLAEQLKSAHPNAPQYPAAGGVKLAAGWLIEQAGWKGYSEGDFGVHDRQALVLVNRGDAQGTDIYDLSQRILDDVKAKFGIDLEREVNII
jgi:UDP-N-acetylmuramate dehydrogenase